MTWLKKIATAALLSSMALPAMAARVDVVKIMSFSCSICAASEAIDAVVGAAVTNTGGKYVPAPVPTVDGRTGYLEKVYYAGRDISPQFAESLKKSFYKAVQTKGLALDSEQAVLVWLQADLPAEEKNFDRLFAGARAEKSTQSLMKTLNIVQQVGAVDTPTYVLLVKGEIRDTITVAENKGSVVATRSVLLNKINSYAKE